MCYLRLETSLIYFILCKIINQCESLGTMSKTVDPVVAEVHSQEGEPPGPGRVPWQLHKAVVFPHIHVRCQLTASHQQPEGESTFCVL